MREDTRPLTGQAATRALYAALQDLMRVHHFTCHPKSEHDMFDCVSPQCRRAVRVLGQTNPQAVGGGARRVTWDWLDVVLVVVVVVGGLRLIRVVLRAQAAVDQLRVRLDKLEAREHLRHLEVRYLREHR